MLFLFILVGEKLRQNGKEKRTQNPSVNPEQILGIENKRADLELICFNPQTLDSLADFHSGKMKATTGHFPAYHNTNLQKSSKYS